MLYYINLILLTKETATEYDRIQRNEYGPHIRSIEYVIIIIEWVHCLIDSWHIDSTSFHGLCLVERRPHIVLFEIVRYK